jgi:hypothetical protein
LPFWPDAASRSRPQGYGECIQIPFLIPLDPVDVISKASPDRFVRRREGSP